jgi:hypothetical protein
MENLSLFISKLPTVLQDHIYTYNVEHRKMMIKICQELKQYHSEEMYCSDTDCECSFSNIHCADSECGMLVHRKKAIFGSLYNKYYCSCYCCWNHEYECRKSFRKSLR